MSEVKKKICTSSFNVTCVSYKLIILGSKSPESQYQITPCHKVHIRFTAEEYSCIISLLLFQAMKYPSKFLDGKSFIIQLLFNVTFPNRFQIIIG